MHFSKYPFFQKISLFFSYQVLLVAAVILPLSHCMPVDDLSGNTAQLQKPVLREQWGVSSGHPLATQAGIDILNQGGNAIDAAVAVAYALGVVEPQASGVGGGGEMIIYRSSDQSVRVIDYRDTSPSSYSPLMIGKHVSGIPGLVKGMDYLLTHYGTFSRSEVMAPAIGYAEKGVAVSKTLARFLSQYNGYKVSSRKTPQFFKRGRLLKIGELMYQRDLASLLRRIAGEGSGAFYQGSCAMKMLAAMNRKSHTYSEIDLSNYPVRDIPAISAPFRTFEVYTVPGGGVPLLEMLRLAEISGALNSGLKEEDRLAALLKAAQIVYRHRRAYLGDPPFRTEKSLLNDRFLKKQWTRHVKQPALPEDDQTESTTHFVIVDRWGNWVSSTQTLSDFFGNGQCVNGFFLNNSMLKFSVHDKSPNAAAPNKRPFSYIAPCLIFQSGRPVLGIGSPGGYRIPFILSQTLVQHLNDGVPLKDAVNAWRYYLSNRRNTHLSVFFEQMPSPAIRARLIKEGFKPVINSNPIQYGAIQALEWDEKEGVLAGAADWRRGGNFSCRK